VTVVVDTSVLIDVLRQHDRAKECLHGERRQGTVHASELTRVELLCGMRKGEVPATRGLLEIITWVPVTEEVAERAGELGRAWLPSHGGIDLTDLVIASTAQLLDARLLTRNVKAFPMFDGLAPPY
jgi:predicted nucleic acid-binding protein